MINFSKKPWLIGFYVAWKSSSIQSKLLTEGDRSGDHALAIIFHLMTYKLWCIWQVSHLSPHQSNTISNVSLRLIVSSKQSTTLQTNETTYLSENVLLIECSHLLTGTPISSNEKSCNSADFSVFAYHSTYIWGKPFFFLRI